MPERGKTHADLVESLRRWLILQADAKDAQWTLKITDGREYTITHSEEASGDIVVEGQVVT